MARGNMKPVLLGLVSPPESTGSVQDYLRVAWWTSPSPGTQNTQILTDIISQQPLIFNIKQRTWSNFPTRLARTYNPVTLLSLALVIGKKEEGIKEGEKKRTDFRQSNFNERTRKKETPLTPACIEMSGTVKPETLSLFSAGRTRAHSSAAIAILKKKWMPGVQQFGQRC